MDRIVPAWAPSLCGKASGTTLQKFCLGVYICVSFRIYETLGTWWSHTKTEVSHQSRSHKELISSILHES